MSNDPDYDTPVEPGPATLLTDPDVNPESTTRPIDYAGCAKKSAVNQKAHGPACFTEGGHFTGLLGRDHDPDIYAAALTTIYLGVGTFEMLTQHYLDGMSLRDVAAVHGVSHATVAKRFKAASRKLGAVKTLADKLQDDRDRRKAKAMP